ncbi:kinesin-domain-containing protein [Ascobolus immersus RN42]|uniref:Kinesin-domain-containing protein n=1 Tax=Ascobolus immersus RN42 TaxID=1160509 RepID=A0A3N4J0Y9_ASCIM|nr:kinesin-domain-containing protein [Ascobolus immersus RN42]
MEDLDSGASSISVTVRVRPFTIREAAQIPRCDDSPAFFGDGSLAATPQPKITSKGIRKVIKVIDDRVLVFDPPEDNPLARFGKQILGPQGKRVKDMRFGFDKIFDEDATQEEVYQATSQKLLDNVLDGFNATVFAYGATGCGKTHTISGTKQHPGIIFLTMRELYEKMDALKHDKDIELTLSYLEIYNETIRDLLVPGGSKQGLALREDANKTIAVAGLSTHKPAGVDEVMDMILEGNANRTVSPTDANAVSSRSHAVLQINISQRDRTAGLSENHMFSTLSIIDLAGSERASVTKNRGDRLLEGANINRSLLALGNCINALCENKKGNHIPYRDSKLTRLLKFSLGGNCKTVMIVCVSPSSQHYDETHNTLKYADRAKKIKTKVSRNMMNVDRHVSQYVKAIFDLRQEVEDLKRRLGDSTKDAMVKVQKTQNNRDLALREASRRIKVAHEQSKEARNTRIQDMKSLRLMEKRANVVASWIAAFDQVFASRQDEAQLAGVFSVRMAADQVLMELQSNRNMLQQRLSSSNPEKAYDNTVSQMLEHLRGVEGVTDMDISAFKNEAQMLSVTADRDMYQALAEYDSESTNSVQSLTKAHFESVATINKLITVEGEDAMEVDQDALRILMQSCVDATSHVVKPSGELVSTEGLTSAPSGTPRRKKSFTQTQQDFQAPPASAFQPPVSFIPNPSSPVKNSPRRFRVRTPRKAGGAAQRRKEKKKVRWQDEETDEPLGESMPTPVRYREPPPSQSLPSQSSQPGLMGPPPRRPNFGPQLDGHQSAPDQSEGSASFQGQASALQPQPQATLPSSPVQQAARRPQQSNENLEHPGDTSISHITKNRHLQAGFLSRKSGGRGSGSPTDSATTRRQSLSAFQPLQEFDEHRLLQKSNSNYDGLGDTSMSMNPPAPVYEGVKPSFRASISRDSAIHKHRAPRSSLGGGSLSSASAIRARRASLAPLASIGESGNGSAQFKKPALPSGNPTRRMSLARMGPPSDVGNSSMNRIAPIKSHNRRLTVSGIGSGGVKLNPAALQMALATAGVDPNDANSRANSSFSLNKPVWR